MSVMDLDDFRSILETAGVDVWSFIDTAILVASLDYGGELKQRRDRIVERLYATSISSLCRNCDFGVAGVCVNTCNNNDNNNNNMSKKVNERESNVNVVPEKVNPKSVSPSTPQSNNGDDDVDEELDPYGGLFDDEQKRVLEIKEQLKSEDSLVDLLQTLADMDITFKALKETDIGRHVNRLRKHPSNEVKRLVKQLVRKWKEIVDEWVKFNNPGEVAAASLMADGDSPQQKIPQNGHHQVPDFAYSPNPHNGSSGSDKNNSEPERKPKPVISRRETPSRPSQSPSVSTPASVSTSASYNAQRQREPKVQKNSTSEAEKLASARKRLQANYKEAENAKKQRTIQVMDIHEIPKPKNSYFGRNKGGSSQGRHW